MKLTLNKKALKNLSRDSQILPDDMTPQIGGGMTAAATCPATAPQTQCINDGCGTSDNVCGGGSAETCAQTCGAPSPASYPSILC